MTAGKHQHPANDIASSSCSAESFAANLRQRQPAEQIALAFPRGAHQERFIQGVAQFAAAHQRNWSFTVAPESLLLSILELKGWKGQGVLAALNTPEEAACALQLAMPVVNISSALEVSPVPRSMVDNLAIGMHAAEHLVGRGFRSFAYYGLEGVEYSKQRYRGFVQRLEENAFQATMHLSTPTFCFDGERWNMQHESLKTWLKTLDSPCGVFVASDYRACQVLDACLEVGISPPDQLAVIGVDNEQAICEHVTPTLTSVARNDVAEGYSAAVMLDALMQGAPLESSEAKVPPLEVVERKSTAAFAVSDTRLQKALAYLHEYSHDPITVVELASHAEVSRRWLEYAFREVFDETPYQYLRRHRLLKAKQLLSDEPKTRIADIAKRTGFSSVKQMRVAFQQSFGVTPGDFRRRPEG